MGAINYFTSDYITLGVKPYDANDYIKDNDFMDFIRGVQVIKIITRQ